MISSNCHPMREECAERGLEVIENLCKRLVEEYGETFGEDSVHIFGLTVHPPRSGLRR